MTVEGTYVGQVADFAVGTPHRVEVGGVAVCIVRGDGDEFYAIEDRCTHEDACLSDGWVDGTEIECPRHNAMFDLRTGEPTSLPAVVAAQIFPVHIEDGALRVVLDAYANSERNS